MPTEADEHDNTIASVGVAEAVCDFNASNEAHDDLVTGSLQATASVRHDAEEEQVAREARDAHRAVEAENRRPRASLPLGVCLAAVTIAFLAIPA
jgi:hypothetical protein